MHPGQMVSAELSLDEVKSQTESGELANTRYFGDFAVTAKGIVPGLRVEGERPGAFYWHVNHVSV